MRRNERLTRPRERRVREASGESLEATMRLQDVGRERSGRLLIQIPRVAWLPRMTNVQVVACDIVHRTAEAPKRRNIIKTCQGVAASIPPQVEITLADELNSERVQRVRNEPCGNADHGGHDQDGDE